MLGARGDGAAGDEAAAADRNDEDVEIRHLLEHLQRDRPLAGDDVRIVVGVDPDQVALHRNHLGARLRFGESFALKDDVAASRLGRLDLHERCRHRHDDGCRDAEPPRVISHRLGVIAGRHRDHAAAALVGVERAKLDAGAALLERIGDLQILVFDVDLGAGQRRKRRRRQDRRPQHVAGDRAAGGFDGGQRHHDCFLSRTTASRAAPWPQGLFPYFWRRYNVRVVTGLLMIDSGLNAGPDSRSSRIGIAADIRPHAYDPLANPELFEGLLTRRVVAFIIDLIVIAVPLVAAAMFIFVFGLVTFGLGWALFWLLSPASVIWALFYYGTTLGSPASATLGMRAMEIEMRTWYGAPAYFVLGAVHPIIYWVSVSVLTPLVLVVGFLNPRRRLLHDMLVGVVIINNAARAAALRVPMSS